MEIEKHHVQYFTATIHNWMHLLKEDDAKLIIIEALKFRIAQGQVKVGVYVIMPNHVHIIWRIQNNFELEDVQRDFLKFTAKKIIERTKAMDGERKLEKLYVGLSDRQFQVWKRNSMSIDLFSRKFINQKADYIHNNPCQPHWNLATHPTEYRFSSSGFYETGEDEFNFLTHLNMNRSLVRRPARTKRHLLIRVKNDLIPKLLLVADLQSQFGDDSATTKRDSPFA